MTLIHRAERMPGLLVVFIFCTGALVPFNTAQAQQSYPTYSTAQQAYSACLSDEDWMGAHYAAGGKTTEQVYDSTGALHKQLTGTFNTLGQLTSVVDGLGKTVFNASASTSYDANGNLVQSSDGLGIPRRLGYAALNRLVQTIDNYNGTN